MLVDTFFKPREIFCIADFISDEHSTDAMERIGHDKELIQFL